MWERERCRKGSALGIARGPGRVNDQIKKSSNINAYKLKRKRMGGIYAQTYQHVEHRVDEAVCIETKKRFKAAFASTRLLLCFCYALMRGIRLTENGVKSWREYDMTMFKSIRGPYGRLGDLSEDVPMLMISVRRQRTSLSFVSTPHHPGPVLSVSR